MGPEFVSGLGSVGVQMALTAHHAAVCRWEVCEGLLVSSWSWGSLVFHLPSFGLSRKNPSVTDVLGRNVE